MSLFRTKSVEQSIADTDEPGARLRKDLSAFDLTLFGIGVIVGAGIFVYTGTVAAQNSGPAISISFLVAGVACALAALCYAEFASTLPVAGSAYTFSYATFGEFVAWMIGWDLVLEFTVAGAALSVSFSGYLQQLLDGTPFELPAALASSGDGFVNLPAVLVALLVTFVLSRGTKLASVVNQVIVAIKLSVIALVVVMGIGHVKTANWSPFVPDSQPVPSTETSFADSPLITTLFGLEPAVFGWAGVMAGAAVVFFAFLGFDVVATVAEETRNPQRDVPIGILASLATVTGLYVVVSLVVTGMRSYTEIDPDDSAPLATAFDAVGQEWVGTVISVGATIGLVVVAMTLIMGQTRVGFAMARDGLLPRALAKVHPTHGTPSRITWITGVAVALLAGFVDFATLGHLVSIGTLFAFVLVAIGVVVLRRTRPDLQRSFRVKGVYVVSTLSVLLSVYLMLNLVGGTWLRFLGWLAIGVVVYFAYGRRHSVLGQRLAAEAAVGQEPTEPVR